MKVSVLLEQRFAQSADGAVWTPGPFPLSFFRRYLDVFDSVEVVARVRGVGVGPAGWRRADGEGVRFRAIAYYVGPFEYVRSWWRVRANLRAAFRDAEAVVLRVPSQLANVAEPGLRRRGTAYALEIVGDPRDAFSAGACGHPLRWIFRHFHTSRLRRQCARTPLLAYVTRGALQRRYAPNPRADHTHYSSVELATEAFAGSARVFGRERRLIRLITVGSLEHRYKGIDVLIRATASLGPGYELTIVGEGGERECLRELASALGGVVCFRGQLAAGAAVRGELDRADIFVLPSRQEGLPRALLEAMARGLPCVASDVGGCSELLSSECLTPPNQPDRLAAAIRRIAADPTRAACLPQQNLRRARDFADARIQPRRIHLYRELRRRAEGSAPGGAFRAEGNDGVSMPSQRRGLFPRAANALPPPADR